ncbi:3-oxoacid CoA-transferase subunit B [Clostridium estertheticum]|uniref:3-oxoacid CoA-transferase subunit B n=1 Tax=Clostridium estertheticum TaxID=238834 RepID=UPI001C7E0894|nr:3-oxoacid CoA-transferase subunit B [Clostridium estertheticum]MBX4267880.1 3-oxoacid CoA-transferase subunit B [Clostridium estertheticum]WLC78112.1 3-oxoacid CoA-transferase subunit B [Clostridium estertheticum]
MDSKEFIARRIAKELKDGDVVNLGIGLPTMVANFIPEGINVILQSENGFIGLGQAPEAGKEDKDIVNAGAQFVTIKKSGSYFDSATSFGIIRGGHVHATVLGALQVDQKGNLANHMIPGKMVPGMGGAMDLVSGAKRVIIAMTHTAKGEPKILKKCRLPLTAVGKVNLIVTEMAVIEVTSRGLILKEIAPGISIKDVLKGTEADLIIDDNLKIIEV